MNSERRYSLTVRGRLDPQRASWFPDLTLVPGDADHTILVGRIADQAALHGILRRLGELGLEIIALQQVSPPEDA